jgi:hypothetical protein
VEEFTGGPAWISAEATNHGFFVRRGDGSRQRFGMSYDAKANTLTARGNFAEGTAGKSWTLKALVPEPGALELEGTLADEAVRVKLRRTDRPAFPLETRGFHWVNEFPYNR